MTKEELIAIAQAAARRHGLAPALVCAVCEQESGWNTWAMRYEIGFRVKYVSPLDLEGKMVTRPPCTKVTEAVTRATSFGLMQIMGQVARERGFVGVYLSELCNPILGVEYGCLQLKRKLEKANQAVVIALLAYNGGGNPNYPAEVQARMGNYLESGSVKERER